MVEGVRPGRIGGFSPVAGETRAGTGGTFKVDMGAGAVARNARPSGSSAIGFEGMLALQAVDEDQERNRSARKRGLALIAALTDLQRAMLAAEDPALALRSLSALASDGPLAADPGLAAVLRAVVLRARVEMARRGG